ncbi:hypothetical protein K474DRAFT_1708794 [Panus rudis PR-1116 ss-1]|nr:hypothetical protein K474DRAFT_1708794 [Panus rudis PR-1116 ss-1]
MDLWIPYNNKMKCEMKGWPPWHLRVHRRCLRCSPGVIRGWVWKRSIREIVEAIKEETPYSNAHVGNGGLKTRLRNLFGRAKANPPTPLAVRRRVNSTPLTISGPMPLQPRARPSKPTRSPERENFASTPSLVTRNTGHSDSNRPRTKGILKRPLSPSSEDEDGTYASVNPNRPQLLKGTCPRRPKKSVRFTEETTNNEKVSLVLEQYRTMTPKRRRAIRGPMQRTESYGCTDFGAALRRGSAALAASNAANGVVMHSPSDDDLPLSDANPGV